MATSANPLHFFGIRHHGPGCARSLLQALEQLQPDCLLVEGPPEGESLLPMLQHADLQPPVAMLVYVQDSPAHAAFYPYAEFSPEWQALQWAARQGVATRLWRSTTASSSSWLRCRSRGVERCMSVMPPSMSELLSSLGRGSTRLR